MTRCTCTQAHADDRPEPHELAKFNDKIKSLATCLEFHRAKFEVRPISASPSLLPERTRPRLWVGQQRCSRPNTQVGRSADSSLNLYSLSPTCPYPLCLSFPLSML
jgi:hypothetical protein